MLDADGYHRGGIEKFINDWIIELSKSVGPNRSYSGPACPYAKSIWEENKVKIIKVDEKEFEFKKIDKFWSTVSSECNDFNKHEYDVVIVAVIVNDGIINGAQLAGGVDALNSFLNTQNKNLWLLDYQWHAPTGTQGDSYTMAIIQKITDLDDHSKILEGKGYYTERYGEQVFNRTVLRRRQMREKLTLS